MPADYEMLSCRYMGRVCGLLVNQIQTVLNWQLSMSETVIDAERILIGFFFMWEGSTEVGATYDA